VWNLPRQPSLQLKVDPHVPERDSTIHDGGQFVSELSIDRANGGAFALGFDISAAQFAYVDNKRRKPVGLDRMGKLCGANRRSSISHRWAAMQKSLSAPSQVVHRECVLCYFADKDSTFSD
jgi:hypothetical protein